MVVAGLRMVVDIVIASLSRAPKVSPQGDAIAGRGVGVGGWEGDLRKG